MSQQSQNIRQTLNKLPLRRDIYADAGFDPATGKAVLSHCTLHMDIAHTESCICPNSNEAELKSVLIAMDMYPNAIILTDSAFVVQKLNNVRVKHIPREQNVANILVRAYKEQCVAHNPHKSPTKKED